MSTDLQLASGSPAQRYKDLKFYRPTREAHYLHLEGLFREPIDKQLIAENYSEMLKVAVPIKAGNLYPSTIMWRLNSFSHDNRLYLAFRELGRVIRTEFLLNLH